VELDRLAVERAIEKVARDHDFSGVVSLRRAGSIVLEEAFGFSDRENQIPNHAETRLGIASGTKFFTALSVGKLIELGKLSLTTKLKDVLDVSAFDYSPEITIQHLLTHTSGIPDYYDEEKIDDTSNFTVAVPWSDLRGPRDYLQVFPREEMKFEPGARFSYSNGGYILLGVIIEELSGENYQSFVEGEIFQELGMKRSGYFAMNRLPENTAKGYIDEPDGQWRTNEKNLPIVGASDGGAFTTVGDLSILWDGFWAGQILKVALVEEFAAPFVQAATEGPHKSYGYGLWIHDDGKNSQRVYITGCDAGVSFQSSVTRTEELQVSVLSNTSDGAWPVLRTLDGLLFSD